MITKTDTPAFMKAGRIQAYLRREWMRCKQSGDLDQAKNYYDAMYIVGRACNAFNVKKQPEKV